ncbi:MAG TPA: alpha/beta fold hydrolase [Bacteroidia bacterium]|nr:alpha/beta fold hydrolase [Bacteroidia bacterium]
MKPHIIFLHGALASGEQLKELAELVSDGAITHVITFRGHGNAPLESGEFTVDTLVDDVVQYMNTHAISSAGFFGYSMGGYVALSLAANHPARVSGIVTLGTKLDWNQDTAAIEVARLNPVMMERKIPDFVNALDKVHTAVGWKKIVELTGLLMFRLGEKHLLDKDFSKILIPVTLCVGETDKMVSIIETQKVAGMLPNGNCVVLENTGHVFEVADRHLLAKKIRASFLNQ